MSIKTKAEKLKNKSKEFIRDHHTLIEVAEVSMIAVGAYIIGGNIRQMKIQLGIDRMLDAGIVGFGAFKDGNFVQISQEEACKIVRAYNNALKYSVESP